MFLSINILLFLPLLVFLNLLINAAKAAECQKKSTDDLRQYMIDRSIYQRRYMAATLTEAAENFDDLSSSENMRPSTGPPNCDETCEKRRQEILTVFYTKSPWRRMETPSEQKEWVKNGNGSPHFVQAPPGENASSLPQDKFINIGRRKKRLFEDPFSVGKVYIQYCSKEGFQELPGYRKLCGACRAMRELPDTFFPKWINQVHCTSEHECLSGHGTCVQRGMSLTVLYNQGTAECQDWKHYTLMVPVCCDCHISGQSQFYKQFVA